MDPDAFVDIAPPDSWTPVGLAVGSPVPFRATFDCLWCGAAHTCRGPDDLEGWAQLCPDCVGKAGDNGFLRFRLRQALTERSAGGRPGVAGPGPATAPAAAPPAPSPTPVDRDLDREMVAYYEARAPEYDDWYLRRGRYARGAIHDAAWDAELDVAGRWLDALPIARRDRRAGRRDRLVVAAARLEGRAVAVRRRRPHRWTARASACVAHGCGRTSTSATPGPSRIGRSTPCSPASGSATSPRDRLAAFLALVRRWLKPGGRFAFIDSLPDARLGRVRPPDPRGRPGGAPARRRPAVHDRQGLLRARRAGRAPWPRRVRRRRGHHDRPLLRPGHARPRPRRPASGRPRASTGAVAILRRDVPPCERPRSRPSAPASWPRR